MNVGHAASYRGPFMKRFLYFSIFIASAAFLPSAAMASGALGNVATASYGAGGGYVETRVEQWEERLERLLAYQAAGAQYYGNSKVPIAKAIAKTQRQLAMYQAAAAAGTPFPPVGSESGYGGGGYQHAPNVTAAAAGPAPKGLPASKPDTGVRAGKPDV
jgi:hypothetical protein